MTKPGAILLIHGSKYGRGGEQADAEGSMLAGRLQTFLPNFHVTWCCLEYSTRRIEQAVDELVEKGIKEIVIAPYFLFEGWHMINDLPEDIGAMRKKYPMVEIIRAESLGHREFHLLQMATNITKAYIPEL